MVDQQKTVLIIEDDAFIVDVMRKKLEARGCVVISAHDAQSGLDIMKSQKIDLVVLDILLPSGPNGFSFLQNLKQDSNLGEIPVVILSNLSERQDIEKGLRLGAMDFFVKSNHAPNEVVGKVEQILLQKVHK